MQKKTFRAALFLTILTALLVCVLCVAVSYGQAEDQTKTQLWQELAMLSSLKEKNVGNDAFLNTLGSLNIPNRLTWILADGSVAYDNQSNPQTMQNHLDRQEIIEAEQNGTGYAIRHSETLLEELLYCATRLEDGGFLRIAATQRSLGGRMGQMAWMLALGIAAIVAIAAALSRAWTRRLVKPINEIDLEEPLSNHVYDELAPMLRRMAEQKRKLEAQLREISDRRGELDAIIGHMNEGLLILDAHRRVLMMNESARGILHTNKPVDGLTGIAMYNRTQVLLDAVDTAISSGSAHVDMNAGDREYLLTASVVRHREGLVLLLQDVTERNLAEQSRKRFTANVSHELRTPLTNISGYAELLYNGMTQPQDIPLFARKIYNESRRLLQLIQDIMHLSKLDEGFSAGRMKRVDLLDAARQAAAENAEIADECGVTVTVVGESAEVKGDSTLIDEMLRNVIENGIKYNQPDGEVRVTVTNDGEHASVTVKDNGIGIPIEHQDKVFERFYRVDGSRSKMTGGTGLGLSIVKHGAHYHNAEITLSSEKDVGTTVTIRFPMQQESETDDVPDA